MCKYDIVQDVSFILSLSKLTNAVLKLSCGFLFIRYAGPDSSQVSEEFTLNWGSYLASNRSFIYGVIDGRGSALKGDKYLFAGYRNLGTVEVEDQILVTK